MVVIVAYGFIALPICALLAFHYGKGYLGIVFGMTLGTFLQCCGNATIALSTDWNAESHRAVERNKLRVKPAAAAVEVITSDHRKVEDTI